MADATDKPQRKSVAFSNGATAIDEDGNSTAVNGSESKDSDAAVDEVTDMFKDLAKKKKKKPKKEEDDGDAEKGAGDDGELDLSGLKKKKKKKVKPMGDPDDFEAKLKEAGAESGEEGDDKPATATEEGEAKVDEGDMMKGTGIWAHEASKSIPYVQLLSRFFTLLHERHPDLAGGSAKSYKIPPPSCLREGNKKTIFANINEIAKRLKRTDEHITQFLFAEMGTSGSVDGSKRLVIKGRFQSKQIENILRRYIVEYVTCKTCRSPDTELIKGEARLNYLQCNSCNSRRSVQPIKTGFSAQIGKRKRQQT